MFTCEVCFPLRLAVVIGLCAWLMIKYTAAPPLPDWHQGELVMVVPNIEMETDSAFEAELAALFAKHLNVKLRLLHQTPDAAVASLHAGQGSSGCGLS